MAQEQSQEVAVIEAKPEVTPIVLTDQAIATIKHNIDMAQKLVYEVLEEDIDYGIHPGTESMALRDPGASKIANAFNTYPEHIILHAREDEDVISYLIQAKLVNRNTDKVVAIGVGGCSTMESKYGFRYVWHPQDYGYDKSQLKFKKGKGWRIPNPEVVDLGNTILKMATKRAEIDACQSLPGVGSALRKLFTGAGAKPKETLRWDTFWGQVSALGISEEEVHQMLGVKSMKDWLSAGKSLNDAITVLSQKLTNRGTQTSPPAEAETPAPAKAKRNAETIKTIQDLYYACHADFNLQPKDVPKELGISSQSEIADVADAYRQIASVREEIPPEESPGEESHVPPDEGLWEE